MVLLPGFQLCVFIILLSGQERSGYIPGQPGYKRDSQLARLTTESTAKAFSQECKEKHDMILNPFTWVTESYDIKNVLYVCDFHVFDHNYTCNFTNEGFHHDLPEERKEQFVKQGNQYPFVKVIKPVKQSPQEDSNSTMGVDSETEINIELTDNGERRVKVFCNLPMFPATLTSQTQTPHIEQYVQSGQWVENSGIITENSVRRSTSGVVAKCFFRSATFECFGVPTCSAVCDEPCYGGEPWRGNYTGNPKQGFLGVITDEALASAGSSALDDDVVAGPLETPSSLQLPVAICSSDKDQDECQRWKANVVFVNQFDQVNSKLCENLVFILSS